MEKSVILAGFGGQGVILAGKILAQAGMDHSLQVTWFPSYGPEMRGDTANCTVVLSEEPVASPLADDTLIAMNPPSLDKFESTVGGTIVLSLIERPVIRTDVKVVPIPMNEMAAKVGSHQHGCPRSLHQGNGCCSSGNGEDSDGAMLEKDGKGEFVPMNEQALQRMMRSRHEQ